MRRISWEQWERNRESAQERLAALARAFPRPYHRTRRRAPEEARLLRERGTPEELIGPERR
jgi:hypothetical protein